MNRIASRLKPVARAAALGLVLAGALAACTATYRKHGYVPSEEELAQITPGVDTRDTVIETLGAPGASGVLNDSGVYYMVSNVRHYGARQPEVVSRQLVAISFGRGGVVAEIERFGLEDGQVVPLQRRVTSSSVADKTFLRQLLGNLGRFNPSTALGE